MLNISNNNVSQYLDITKFKSGATIFKKEYHKGFKRILWFFSFLLLIIIFLPWTQNISSKGKVTTLFLSDRPQTIQSPIPGRIEQWFVQEGDFVKKGDTILRISEIKSDYFDGDLATRTKEQLGIKNQSVQVYKDKAKALKAQIQALAQERDLKLQQAKNKAEQTKLKIQTDSIAVLALEKQKQVAQTQYQRVLALQKEGLKSQKEVEQKAVKNQEVAAKLVEKQNKYRISKNDFINAVLYVTTLKATYQDKIAKARSNFLSAESAVLQAQTDVSKLQTKVVNYTRRKALLYVTASQDGVIHKAIKSGIGEAFKAGEKLVAIMPSNHRLAVEMYVRPIDLPLIHKGELVRVQFDGWPAIVFSGWPAISYGTYGAKVVAIESFISDNGMFRVLLAPDESTAAWPEAIRVGSGARTIALLENVPIWYEIWRQINSFPPNFYQPEKIDKKTSLISKKK